MKELYKKLLAVQEEVKAITKDSSNPYFNSEYFDINGLLAELKPVLNTHKLVVMQPLNIHEGKTVLETLVIDEESGQMINSKIILPENTDPQKMGSAITYFRRYALQSMFLLQAQDDDGNRAAGNETAVKHRPAAAVTRRPVAAPARPVARATAPKPVAPRGAPSPESQEKTTLCQDCYEEGESNAITTAEADYSTKFFGRPLCRKHQGTATRI